MVPPPACILKCTIPPLEFVPTLAVGNYLSPPCLFKTANAIPPPDPRGGRTLCGDTYTSYLVLIDCLMIVLKSPQHQEYYDYWKIFTTSVIEIECMIAILKPTKHIWY